MQAEFKLAPLYSKGSGNSAHSLVGWKLLKGPCSATCGKGTL